MKIENIRKEVNASISFTDEEISDILDDFRKVVRWNETIWPSTTDFINLLKDLQKLKK